MIQADIVGEPLRRGQLKSPTALVHAFYKARQANDPDALRQWLSDDVRWNEPVVGDHMEHLRGAHAVVDMLKHALATTGGTFSLRVASIVGTGSHCAAVIEWSADENGEPYGARKWPSSASKAAKSWKPRFSRPISPTIRRSGRAEAAFPFSDHFRYCA